MSNDRMRAGSLRASRYRARGGVRANLGRGAVGLCGLVFGLMACNQIAGIESGVPIECATVEECAARAPACHAATACEQGVCVFEDTAEGVPSAQQTPGDCLQAVCDGTGKVKLVPLQEDAPKDGSTCTPSECVTVQDCAAKAPVCRTATACEKGVCVLEDVLEGTPVAEQTPGDCLQAVCNGTGKVKLVPLADDPPDDGNLCTLDTCVGATPKHTPQAKGACKTGLLGVCSVGVQQCDAAGQPVGKCVGPAPKAEQCEAAALDEDCDGEVNEEGVDCTCGDGWVSTGEQCDDGGTKGDHNCSAVCQDQKVLQVVAGYGHTCARLSGGSVKCWGNNDFGQLGQGDTAWRGDGPNEMGDKLAAVPLGTGRAAQAIAARYKHTCALLDDGSVKCWGNNDFGQLGMGDMAYRGDEPDEMGDKLAAVPLGTGRTAKAVAAGSTHTCALLDDGHVKCWGYNDRGQLGMGDTAARGDGPNEMGDKLAAVPLGTGRTAKAVAAGSTHTCALLDNGHVKCWGYNDRGQLGMGNTAARGDGSDEMGDKLAAVPLGTGRTAQAIAAGSTHTCALLDDGSVKCWGDNFYGELGMGDAATRGDGPNEMGDKLAAVPLGTGRTAQAIAAGYLHTCALLDDGRVKCWGWNFYGELGMGDTAWRGDGPDEMGDKLAAVPLGTGRTAQAIAVGYGHTCALLDDASVKCWGYNFNGQLGQGDMANRGDGPDEMGDKLPRVKLYSDVW